MGNIETSHLREYGFRKYPKICLLVESGTRNPESGKFRNLGFEKRNTAQGIRNPTNSWNLQSEIYCERIRYPRRRIQNQSLSWISLLGDCICIEFLKRAGGGGRGGGEEGCKHAKENCVIELCLTLKC